MRVFFILAILSHLGLGLKAQMDVSLGGMSWSCSKEGEYLVMELRAPTTGWVAVGFNGENNILHSDLLMFHIVNGKVETQDMYVKGIGDSRLDVSLGGSKDLEVMSAEEKGDETYIRFRRWWAGQDRYDYRLIHGEAFWLILAYSTHDDFSHHSSMRKHKEIVFKVN